MTCSALSRSKQASDVSKARDQAGEADPRLRDFQAEHGRNRRSAQGRGSPKRRQIDQQGRVFHNLSIMRIGRRRERPWSCRYRRRPEDRHQGAGAKVARRAPTRLVADDH